MEKTRLSSPRPDFITSCFSVNFGSCLEPWSKAGRKGAWFGFRYVGYVSQVVIYRKPSQRASDGESLTLWSLVFDT